MPAIENTLTEQYETAGFVTVEHLLSTTQLDALRRRMDSIAQGQIPFPESDLEFEPEANGNRDSSRLRKINRCAEHDEVFMAHAVNEKVLDIVVALLGPDIKLFGSQCFMKPSGGVEKPYHQDSAYFTIEPKEIVTCWTALDDVTVDNGCLWVIPGSHRGPILDHDQPWQVGDRVDMQVREEQLDRSGEAPIEMTAGSCSFHHSVLLHRSGANQTTRPRRGLAVHYMSARSRWTHRDKPQPNYPLLRGREYDGRV